VSDQPIVDGSIVIQKVTAGQNGWIVAHLDQGGKPGTVLGETFVNQGDNPNVKIKLSQDVPVGGKLWPMLHVDAGTPGTYEFPGADVPVIVNGDIVMKQITVTQAAPATLPTTGGGDAPLSLVLVALALLAGGFALTRLRRA
jgi:LPXTG-motif cell wall-anchored protein